MRADFGNTNKTTLVKHFDRIYLVRYEFRLLENHIQFELQVSKLQIVCSKILLARRIHKAISDVHCEVRQYLKWIKRLKLSSIYIIGTWLSLFDA